MSVKYLGVPTQYLITQSMLVVCMYECVCFAVWLCVFVQEAKGKMREHGQFDAVVQYNPYRI